MQSTNASDSTLSDISEILIHQHQLRYMLGNKYTIARLLKQRQDINKRLKELGYQEDEQQVKHRQIVEKLNEILIKSNETIALQENQIKKLNQILLKTNQVLAQAQSNAYQNYTTLAHNFTKFAVYMEDIMIALQTLGNSIEENQNKKIRFHHIRGKKIYNKPVQINDQSLVKIQLNKAGSLLEQSNLRVFKQTDSEQIFEDSQK